MSSLEYYGVDEYGNSNGVNLPDFTGCLLLATTPTPPAGTLVADGSEVSREAYAKLFAIFGTQYGEGDGVNTFALPDWRDEFPRFSGADRAVGTKQGDAIREITGQIRFRPYHGLDSGTQNTMIQCEGAFGKSIMALGASEGPQGVAFYSNNEAANFAASRVVPTADENRPRNIAFLPCIIYV